MRTTPRPPLTKRLRPRHWAAIDYVVAALIGLILFASIRKSIGGFGQPYATNRPFQVTNALTLLLVAIAVVSVALRRRRPTFMLGALLAGSVVVAAVSSPDTGALTYFLPVAYVLYLIAATYERKELAARVLAAVFVTLLIDEILVGVGRPPFYDGTALPVILCVIVAWSIGYIVRQRRRYAIGLQEEAASKAVAEERLRIARELHDVVAHSMSVIAVQAGYGQYVIDSQPDDARDALGAIQTTSREALDEMRRMLGALRQADEATAGASSEASSEASSQASAGYAPGSDTSRPSDALGALASLFRPGGSIPAAPSAIDTAAAPLFPAPGLDDLERLVNRTAGAGVQVSLRRHGRPRTLSPSIDLSAYRIIQEALTNVVKHAHTSRCDVLLDYGDTQLTIRVTDSGAGLAVPALAGTALAGPVASARSALADPLPGGHGIIGMRERVSLLGGEFTAGPLPGYGFEVTARIPLPASPA